jgi:hypothetical protein
MQPALLFSDSANFRLTGTVAPAGEMRQLILHSPIRPDIKEYRLFYDTIGYRLQRAEIEWWKGGRSPQEPGAGKIWLAKMEYDLSSRARPDIRKEIATIVLFRNGEAVPTERYHDYKINSNL